MVQLYAKGTTDFSKNGIELRPQESTVTFQDNGQFVFDMVVPAEGGYTSYDYGQIIKATVPEQDLAAISLGEVSYYEVSNSDGATIYSVVPTLKYLSYKQWSASGSYMGYYNVGQKVTYLGHNYQLNSSYDPSSGLTQVPPPNNPSWWDEIPRTTGRPGKVAATLSYGEVVMKTADFNAEYMEAASLSGKAGYIKISDCTATGTTEERIVPARSIRTQLFVITEIRKEQNGKAIRIAAEHISYQLGRTILAECNVVNVTPATALLFIGGAMKESYPGNLYTDLTEPAITADWSWKNAQNAVLDPKDGLLANAGARIIRDNYDVFILSDAQQTPSYSVRYGANMKNVRWAGNVSGLITRIYPLAQTEDGSTLLLPEEFIDTVRTVPFIRPEVLDTKLKIGQKEKQSDGTEIELTEQDVFTRMRKAAANRFNIDKVDQAEIKLDLDWQHMPDTEEYAQFAALKNAAPGEWVEVKNGPLGISELIRMTGYTWDPMLEIYKSATFGDQKTKPTVAGYSIKNGSVGSSAIASGAVGSGAIQQGVITAREIETNSLTADLIASRTISTDLIMANAITSNEITANAITTEKLAAGAITADKIGAGEVTAVKIAANAINADKIDAGAVTAIVAKLGAAHITNGVIDNADIGYAHIVDASVQSLIARDAVTDKYYIDKLAVRNAQIIQATVGELVIKASNGNYYRLDVAANGSVSPTQVTLTAAEIAAGVTSNGHGAIIETDLTVADLSASNMKAISALIDKITASRIDVDELWSRQAFINKLMVQDISSNTYIQSTIGNWTSGSTITQTINSLDSRISSLGYGTVYLQPEEPSHGELVAGDIWIQSQPSGTWSEVYGDYSSWQDIYNNVSTWQTLGGAPIMWVWDGRKWQKQLDSLEADTLETEIQQNAQQIALLASRTTTLENGKYTIVSGITITAEGINISGSQFVKIASGGYFQVTTGNFGIDTNSSTYVLWSGAASAASSPFWVKKSGEIYAISGTIGGFTLAQNSLSSGSGSSYLNINSNSSNTYAMWAGAENVANAPFRLKRDGTVYLTSLIAVGENGSETTVNLRTAGLWKLSYATVKSITVSGNTLTITTTAGTTTFSKAVTAHLVGSWGGNTYTVSADNDPQVLSVSTTLTGSKGTGTTSGTWTITEFDSSNKAYAAVAATGVTGNLFGFNIDATAVYNKGWNDCRAAMTLQERYTRNAGTYGGSNTHYVQGGQYGYTNVGSGWYQTTRVYDSYSRPAAK